MCLFSIQDSCFVCTKIWLIIIINFENSASSSFWQDHYKINACSCSTDPNLSVPVPAGGAVHLKEMDVLVLLLACVIPSCKQTLIIIGYSHDKLVCHIMSYSVNGTGAQPRVRCIDYTKGSNTCCVIRHNPCLNKEPLKYLTIGTS